MEHTIVLENKPIRSMTAVISILLKNIKKTTQVKMIIDSLKMAFENVQQN